MKAEQSIFKEYYQKHSFIDLYQTDSVDAVDIIIPIIHTNELWKANLFSIYREVPVNRLLIGDGGCIDDSIKIAEEFPRVKVLNHREFKSLGYSIRKLIEEVQTEWFLYLHSDVYLPAGWFEEMKKHKSNYEWFGCLMQHTIMIEYNMDYENRPWAGTQMGLKKAFEDGIKHIDDDYVYRQEDFVFSNIVKKAGYREGKISDTYHYHQTIRKPSPYERKINSVAISVEMSKEEEVRAAMMQIKGLIKYLEPNHGFISGIITNMNRLEELQQIKWSEFLEWVKDTNEAWYELLVRERNKLKFVQKLKSKVPYIFKLARVLRNQ